jgi:asparagine synthase (glutamine-hydrolysing)
MRLRRRLLSGGVGRCLNGHRPKISVQAGHGEAPTGDVPLAGMIAADTALLLPDDFLVKFDRATGAALEARRPLVDHGLLELAGRIPSEYKVRDKQMKGIFKEAF